MTKWILGLLLLANIVFFAVMRFGGTLTENPDIPVAQAEISPDKIRLASEVLPAVSGVAAIKPVSAVAAPALAASAPVIILSPVAVVSPKKQCLEWGEFSGSGLVQAQTALDGLQLGDKLKPRTVEHASGFWVYIPPLKNHAEVLLKIKQLKQLGVNEHFVVQEDGAWLNAISLGVFRTEESAQKFLAGLRGKGVHSAKVGERKTTLKFTLFEIAGADAAIADKVRALQKNFPDSEIKIQDCN
ncbi:MAG: SPOR domain-containing protein [Sideroxydans sp.]|nr:SPOR domain-containing protein [Sideroxydans sp.]